MGKEIARKDASFSVWVKPHTVNRGGKEISVKGHWRMMNATERKSKTNRISANWSEEQARRKVSNAPTKRGGKSIPLSDKEADRFRIEQNMALEKRLVHGKTKPSEQEVFAALNKSLPDKPDIVRFAKDMKYDRDTEMKAFLDADEKGVSQSRRTLVTALSRAMARRHGLKRKLGSTT